MKKLFRILIVLMLALSCVEKPVVLPWDPVTPGEESGGNSGGSTGKDPGKDPVEPSKGKPRYLWVDASANFPYFANDRDRIASDLAKVKEMGFTDVIVDVRPTEGTVLFKSKVAPACKKLASWVNGNYKFTERTADFDYLQAFIDEGHKLGLRVNAAVNTFVGGYGGYYGLESVGPMFNGEIPAEWATMVNNESGIESSFSQDMSGTVFLNPANDAVQEYILSILGELAAYQVDGIILDRCRYDDTGLGSDFSDITRAKFAEYLGHEPSRWPVFSAGARDLPPTVSPEQKQWMAFRAKTIHDFVEKAAATVHGVSSKVRFGVYVGAWYSSYYTSGVNWASPKYDTHSTYPRWADSDYKNYGYADHCDFMMLGCYASASSIYGSGEWTMEGFCKQAKKLLKDDTVFAGGPDIGNPSGWEKGTAGGKIPSTIDACINNADGYFCFDLCHIRMFEYWSDFKKGFDNYLKSIQ